MAGSEERKDVIEVGKRFKEEARGHLEALCAIQDRALAQGMTFQYNVGLDPSTGKHQVNNLRVLVVL